MNKKWFLEISLLLFIFLSSVSCQSHKSSPIDPKNIALKYVDKDDAFKKSFIAFLKTEEIPLDIAIPNKYETILPGNSYANYYFNITTDFPDTWKIDRGPSEYSIIRASVEDSAMTISVIAVPANVINANQDSHKDFQSSPIATLNKTFGDYKNYMAKQITSISNIKPYEFNIHEEKIRNTNYLVYSYKYNETVEGTEYAGNTLGYQTILWGVSYTIEYNAPAIFFNAKVIKSVIYSTNYLSPELLNPPRK